MMCSERELELSDDHDGIIDLPEDAPVGTSFAAYAHLDDPVIEIGLTPKFAIPSEFFVGEVVKGSAAEAATLRVDDKLVRIDGQPLVTWDGFVDKVQGADVADGAVWLSTSDDANGLFRVDLKTGLVDALGSAGHVPGEGEGIDATKLKSGTLHVLTVDPTRNPVWFGHFAVS